MLNISEQFANAGKQTFQSQIALLQKLGQKAFESSQKIIALNISTSKTLLGDNHEIAEHWIHSKHPFEFWVKDAHETQPGLHHLFHYERELAHILTSAQAELLTFAFSEVAEIQNELADLGSHLHEHNKAKQDVVKQAAHAYSAEIKSLYPQPRASSDAKQSAKPAEKTVAKPAAKAVAKAVDKAVAKTVAKPVAQVIAKPVAKSTEKPAARAAAKSAAKSAEKPANKSAEKPAQKPAATAKAVSKDGSKPVVKAAAAEKPLAKASVASKPPVKAPAAKTEAKPGIEPSASPKTAKAVSKPSTKPVIAEKPAAIQAIKPEKLAQPVAAEVMPELHHTGEESHRPPMPRPAHKLEVTNEAPSILNLDDQVVE